MWDKITNFSGLRDLTSIGIANVVGSAISGFFWLYLASLIGAENYGELSYLFAVIGIVAVFSSIGSGYTTIVYTAKKINILPATFFVTIISSGIASIVLFFYLENFSLSVYVLTYVVFNLGIAGLFGRKLYQRYAKYFIFHKIMLVVFSLGLYYLIGNDGVILGFSFSFLVFAPVIYKEFKQNGLDFSVLRPRFGFMANSYAIDLAKSFSANTDKLIIAPLVGLTLLGNYYLGMQVITVLAILPNIVLQYTIPKDASGTRSIKLKKITIIVSIILAVIGILFSPILIPFFFPQFNEAVEVIQIMSLALIPRTVSMMIMSKFLGIEKSRFVILGAIIFLIVQIPSIIVLGNIFGLNGIAFSVLLAEIAQVSFFLASNRFLIHFKESS